MPQKPYLPYDFLTQVLIYPGLLSNVRNEQIKTCMAQVGLHHLCPQLGERKLWSKVLSGGERQRLSFARILLNQPKLICLNESTSHLEDTTALKLIGLVRSALPKSIIIVVSHQTPIIESFTMQYNIELHGEN